jgi:hypothetical protein
MCTLLILIAAGCRSAATLPVSPTPTKLTPVVGTAAPGDAGSLPVLPPLTTSTPEAAPAPPPPAELIPAGTSGIRLTATIGPSCPGPERPGQVCTQPYAGEFVVTNNAAEEVARVTTNQDGQALVDLPPGEYTVTPKIEGRFPSGAPVNASVVAGQYVDVTIELDSGIR